MSSLLESVIIKKFHDLDKFELYKIMQLRIDVFVVEQDCPYQDLDGLDEVGTHLWLEEDDEVVSYLRINPPKTRFNEVSFGRIVTKKSVRKKGLSEAIILKSLEIEKILSLQIMTSEISLKFVLGFNTFINFKTVKVIFNFSSY